jgi:hypothetical protein
MRDRCNKASLPFWAKTPEPAEDTPAASEATHSQATGQNKRGPKTLSMLPKVGSGPMEMFLAKGPTRKTRSQVPAQSGAGPNTSQTTQSQSVRSGAAVDIVEGDSMEDIESELDEGESHIEPTQDQHSDGGVDENHDRDYDDGGSDNDGKQPNSRELVNPTPSRGRKRVRSDSGSRSNREDRAGRDAPRRRGRPRLADTIKAPVVSISTALLNRLSKPT